ncbi:MAG: hypothetical protein PHH83_00030 [Patescibacteria group bacterium]|nr:hypothetical protein [Patescibacteria group bacterium]
MINKKSKFILIIVTTIFVFNTILVVPRKVEAQTTDYAHIAVTLGKWAWEKVERVATKFYDSLVTVTFKRVIGNFLNNLAYEAATSLAYGAPGEKKKFFTKGFDEFLENEADAAVGEVLIAFGESLEIKGFDICNPTDPNFAIDLVTDQFKIRSGQKIQARCKLSEMSKKWGEIAQKYIDNPLALFSLNGQSLAELGFTEGGNKNEQMAKVLENLLDPKQSDAAVEISIRDQIQQTEKASNEKSKDTIATARETGGVLPSTDAPTERKLEPSKQAEEDLKTNIGADKKQSPLLTYTGNLVADTAGVFMDTYMAASLKNLIMELYRKALNENESYSPELNQLIAKKPFSFKDYIDQVYSSVKKISFNMNATDIELISEMQMTMRDPNLGIPGNLNDSVIDSDFAEVLRRAQLQDPMTLRQAIEENLINGNKIFGFKDLNNTQILQQPDLSEGISYDNMKKLRKNRVIPVGWELAALKIAQLAKNGTLICQPGGCTLNDVMSQYNQYGNYKYGEVVNDEVQWKTAPDNLCGWRSYPQLNLTQAQCNKDYLRGAPHYLDDIEVKWVGDSVSNERTGICYKYSFDNNGFLSEITEESSIVSEDDCDIVNSNWYYEWMDGGCLIIESGEAPLCGLINPDWVLKAPVQKCFAKGYYSALEMNESSNRYQDCADTRQCLKEDDGGRCIGGYGYCLKEKNIWKFKGDVCDKNYNGCVSITDDENKQQAYLINTLRDCPQEQSGCRKYLSTKIKSDTSYVWDLNIENFFFNRNITSCNKLKEGCNNFINIERGVNLIPNSSFEIDEGREDLIPDGWSVTGFKLSSASALLGRYSLTLDNGLSDNTNITDSLTEDLGDDSGISNADTGKISGNERDGRGINTGKEDLRSNGETSNSDNGTVNGNEIGGGGINTGDLSMNIKIPGMGNYVLSYHVKNISGNSVVVPYINDMSLDDAKFEESEATDWIRKYATYTVLDNSTEELSLSINGRGSFYLDDIQFEFIDQSISEPIDSLGRTSSSRSNLIPSPYNEYGNTSNVFFKKAPDYYNCKSLNPAPECDNYSKYCSKEDNGCELYRPVNGDASVSAIVTQNDVCPSECNKFQSYSQLPNYFDKLEAQDANENIPDPITRNFIADTAQNCLEPSCEEFTNIDSTSQGGEGREYYNFLRQCVTPNDVNNEISIYYTWEGSDTAGFQLKTWKLLESNLSDGNIAGRNAPCTNIAIGGFECSDLSSGRSCDPENDLDCRSFYDMNSISYNRKLSKTIPITDECIRLRRTLSNVVYKVVPSMSQRCSESNVGCIEYKGNNGNNIRNVLIENFEYGTSNPWNFSNGLSFHPSSESLQYGGSSLAVYTFGGATQFTLSYNLTENGFNIIPGREYTLSFWVKKFSDNDTYGEDSDLIEDSEQQAINFENLIFNKARAQENSNLTFTSSVVENPEWELRQLNIIVAPTTITEEDEVLLIINIPIVNSSDLRDGIFIDNITLKEFQNNFYKIRDSWNTPRVCVDNDNNGIIDNKYLGCQEYKDRKKSSNYLYQFSNICNPENVGCRAVIDTKNSKMPFKQVFNAYCNNTGSASNPECTKNKYYYLNNREEPISGNDSDSMIKVPEDTIEYIVEDNKFQCTNSEKGCQNLAILDNSGNPSDVFMVNNPDDYISDDYFGAQNQTLCLSKYNNCVSMEKLDGSYLFKIHPRENLCEYRKAEIGLGLPAGFYKKGTNEACDGLLYNKGYDESMNNIENTLNDHSIFPEFTNSYAAVCPQAQDSCTAFIDPQDNLNQIPQTLNFYNTENNNTPNWKLFDLNINGTIAPVQGNVSATSSGIEFAANSGELARNSYNFSVEQKQIYKLAGFVKFDASSENKNRFISTHLICKKNKNSDEYYYSVAENKLPYAFPDLNSNYFVKENAGNVDKWIYIYGLYTIEPGANFCNVAFYYGGNDGNISIINMSFEKLQGYYTYIDNQNIDRTTCIEPSKEKGCVLFHQVTDPTLRWSSDISYDNSSLVMGNLYSVADSNVLLKVTKDRTCGEWATCGSSIKTVDEKTGQEKNSCISLIGCDSLSADNSQCDNFILRDDSVKPLTFDDYQRQMGIDLSWSEMDYSGYSVPGLYPLDSLSIFPTNTTTKEYELGRSVIKRNVSGQNLVYKFGLGVDPVESYYNAYKYLDSQYKTCRLYPEKDSPFVWTPSIVLESTATTVGGVSYSIPTSLNQRFQNANICQPKFNTEDPPLIDWSLGLNNDCDCNYTKVTYGSSKNLYFPYGYSNIPANITEEYSATTISNKKSQTNFIGWRGFCLERDDSFLATPPNTISGNGDRYKTRCLSWYPVDSISGEIDLYSVAPESKISMPSDSKVCLVADDYVTEEDRVYCAFWSSNESESKAGLYGTQGSGHGYNAFDPQLSRCNVLAYVPAGTKLSQNSEEDFYNYFTNPDNYWTQDEFNDKFVTQTLTNNQDKSYDIIYGVNWPSWYENNVYYAGFHCNLYSEGGHYWREKELKFNPIEFMEVENPEGDLTLALERDFMEDFKNKLLPKFPINQPIDFYYYDEGVKPSGESYVGTDGHGVYEWDDLNSGYRANLFSTDDKRNVFIPLSKKGYGFDDDNTQACSSAQTVGDAYREACDAANTHFGDEFNPSLPYPKGHEVYTDCVSGGDSESMWNPLRHNYYVHYDGTNKHTYSQGWPIGPQSVDDYAGNMSSCPSGDCASSYDDFQSIKACRATGLISDSSDSGFDNVIFHSDNYYINYILKFGDVGTTTDSICTIQNNNICSSIEVGKSNLFSYDTLILRVKDVAQENTNFNVNNHIGTEFGLSSGVSSLRDPIHSNSDNFKNYYYTYSTDIKNSLTGARNNLSNSIVKIANIEHYQYAVNAWEEGNWVTSSYIWDLRENSENNAPIIKQVNKDGEGARGITVNNSNSADIYAVKSLKVNLSFYAYARWGRSPIKEIKLDWYGDDSDTLTLPGPFKNKRAECIRKCADKYSSISIQDWNNGDYCNSDSDCTGGQKCFSYGWGNDQNSCVEDEFNYSFVYVCTPDSDYWIDSCEIAGDEPCCIFNPAVIITDSWGNSSESGMSDEKSIIITTNQGILNIRNRQQNIEEDEEDEEDDVTFR